MKKIKYKIKQEVRYIEEKERERQEKKRKRRRKIHIYFSQVEMEKINSKLKREHKQTISHTHIYNIQFNSIST